MRVLIYYGYVCLFKYKCVKVYVRNNKLNEFIRCTLSYWRIFSFHKIGNFGISLFLVGLSSVLQIILVNNSSKIFKASCFVYTKPQFCIYKKRHVKGHQRKPQVKGNQDIQLLIEWNSLADWINQILEEKLTH